MPVVLTDRTNKVWAAEDPASGSLMIGLSGQRGLVVLEILEFIEKQQKQWSAFKNKKVKEKSQGSMA